MEIDKKTKRKDRFNFIAKIFCIIGTVLIGIGQPLLFYQIGMIFKNFFMSILQVILVFILQLTVLVPLLQSIKFKEITRENTSRNTIGIVAFMNLLLALISGVTGAYFPIFWLITDFPLITSIFSIIYYSGFIITLVGTMIYQNYSTIEKKKKKKKKLNKAQKIFLWIWLLIMIILGIWAVFYLFFNI